VFKFRKSKATNPEDKIQIAYFQWVAWKKLQDPRFQAIWHTANERRCSLWEGKKLKSKGVLAGVYDVSCMIPTPKYHGMFLEIKYGANRPSEAQQKFGDLMKSLGYYCGVVYSLDDAILTTENYLDNKL
jgi:hypothetical protein